MPGRERRQIREIFLAQGLGGLAEHEELVLGGKIGDVPHLVGAPQHALEHLAGRDLQWIRRDVHEVQQEKRRAWLPRDRAESLQIDAGGGVRIAGVPTRVLHIVEERSPMSQPNITSQKPEGGFRDRS